MNSTKDQPFLVDGKKVVVSIVRNRESGERFAMIRGEEIFRVPVDLLGLSAGRDAWMREIRFRCVCCNEPFKASEMEGQLCPKCLEETEAYNELLDRGDPPLRKENEPQ